ncbi:hypothetical protein [Glycomyces albidus]|uniref:Uncharacterized protein n=1 Tax=Glycomyces albidus TaxID=2656774 RepID=A0A6L5G4F9_9ACTN|nr:hypothetical protein [Glycomyces albidus]MQM24525.1 hypothetical protein [Glycomyces albidus]
MPDIEQVTDRPNWRDGVRSGAGAAVAAGAIAAGAAGTSVGWPMAILAAAGAVGWAGGRWRRLAKRPVAAEFDRYGARLYRETAPGVHTRELRPAVEYEWSEIRSIVFWRKREGAHLVTMAGIEPVRSSPRPPRVGEGRVDALEGAYAEERVRMGVPPHISTALARCSVPISASGMKDIEAAVARFRPHLRIADHRRPPRRRERKVY